MTQYTTLTEVKAQLVDTIGSSTDTTYDSLISTLILSASRAIDGYVGQGDLYFYASSSDHPSGATDIRYYDGVSSPELVIDDFLSISELAVSEAGALSSTDYTVFSSSDFFIAPYNAPSKHKPYNKIILDQVNGSRAFYRFKKAVRVTGVFGYSLTPPEDVKQACNIMVVRTFQRSKNAFADAGASPIMGQMFYVKELDPDVKLLLSKYVMENL
jgi:hypothetical protein